MKPYLQLFGLAHIAILAAIVALAALLTWTHRRFPAARRTLRIGLGRVLMVEAILYFCYLGSAGQMAFPSHLPLELCDLSLCLMIVALHTLNRDLFDVTYYFALGGAAMGLLTPDLWEPFPSYGTVQFFAVHGLIVTATLYLVWSGLARPRRGSVARAMLWLNVFAAVMCAFDFAFKANYMYLRAKPRNASLLDWFGPWPWYILAGEAAAWAIFALLYLPFRSRAEKSES